MQEKIEFEIKGLTKMSYNVYLNLHWTKQKEFKDSLSWLTKSHSNNLQLNGGYSLTFHFQFKGRKLDAFNVAHYCKTIEDTIFKQDNKNGMVCMDTEKGDENKVKVILRKIEN